MTLLTNSPSIFFHRRPSFHRRPLFPPTTVSTLIHPKSSPISPFSVFIYLGQIVYRIHKSDFPIRVKPGDTRDRHRRNSRFSLEARSLKIQSPIWDICSQILFTVHFRIVSSTVQLWKNCRKDPEVFKITDRFMVGSIEGRVSVNHLDDAQQNKNFTFKCHREGNNVYSVNSLNFHPVHHTFATTGSDGSISFWDKDSKQRLKAGTRCKQPIPCSAFNHNGSIFAYAVCYDWSKGAINHNPSTAKTHIYLHTPQEPDVKPRARVASCKK